MTPLGTCSKTVVNNRILEAILGSQEIYKIARWVAPRLPREAQNQRSLVDDAIAAAAVATAHRQWPPGDSEAVVKRAIGAMQAEGWLVEEEIASGRFRRGRALKVNWPCTPWPDAGVEVGVNPDEAPLDETHVVVDGEAGGELVNGVVNE